VTGKYVCPGILEPCAITQRRVLPSELDRCAATGKRVLKGLLVKSSLSEARILEEVAVRSITGTLCAPAEAKPCLWSGRKCHPDDLRICQLTGLSVHVKFVTGDSHPRLQPLVDLLNGIKRNADESQLWAAVIVKVGAIIGREKCRVEAAVLSPDRHHLAVCTEVRTLFGLRTHQAGLLYDISGDAIIGRVVQGRRASGGWSEFKR
jgi:hypothetical protein